MIKKFGLSILTLFGVGYFKYAPGTAASFITCLISGLAYYIAIKRAPMMAPGLKSIYDEEFQRTADANRERVSFRIKPAQAYIPYDEP